CARDSSYYDTGYYTFDSW
nr:immunoglobulin heavy chain junction region [Macaca mulatta]